MEQITTEENTALHNSLSSISTLFILLALSIIMLTYFIIFTYFDECTVLLEDMKFCILIYMIYMFVFNIICIYSDISYNALITSRIVYIIVGGILLIYCKTRLKKKKVVNQVNDVNCIGLIDQEEDNGSEDMFL